MVPRIAVPPSYKPLQLKVHELIKRVMAVAEEIDSPLTYSEIQPYCSEIQPGWSEIQLLLGGSVRKLV